MSEHFISLTLAAAILTATFTVNAEEIQDVEAEADVPSVLVFLFSDNDEGPTTTSANFETLKACNSAALILDERHNKWGQDAYADCFPAR